MASVSKVLQSVEWTGISQLPLDDAINFDYGTLLSLLMFDAEGDNDFRSPHQQSAKTAENGRELICEVTKLLTPNQLADFTMSEVEDLIPVVARVLTPIYGAIGNLRYPTKLLRLASETSIASINLDVPEEQKPYDYQQMLERGFFMYVPRIYATIKADIQQDVNLKAILRTRNKKGCPLPRKYGPDN